MGAPGGEGGWAPGDVSPGAFLFSVDLEDVRTMIPGGTRYAERVPPNVAAYLRFLARHDRRATFFTVGNVARAYPDLIGEISAAGHELACHTSEHTPLERLGPDGLRADLERNLAALERAGAGRVRGFRAPIFSLTEATDWAYDVLAELGFSYSSSVLPQASPMYGWPGFGRGCRRMASGLWEIPVSLTHVLVRDVPFAGGVYFRLLPSRLTRAAFRTHRVASEPVVGYFHPYDVDTEQEYLMHAELGDNPLLNALMYVGRGRVFPRLDRLIADGAVIDRYDRYVDEVLEARPA